MAPRRPPDILRKSHVHSEGDSRAREKRALERGLDDLSGEANSELALLIDLDGVVYRGDEPIAGTADAISWLEANEVPFLFVTNTTSRPRAALVEKLAAFGIDTVPERILTPPDAAAAWLAERECRRLRLLVPTATEQAFDGFDIVRADIPDAAGGAVDAVVVGDFGEEWTWPRLNEAFRSLMRSPRPQLVALGMTRYWSAPDGLRLDTAPFVMALAHASGVDPIVLGKPAAAFFEAGLARLGAAAGRTAMIGDDIRVDIGGAQDAGLKGILVRTGKFRPADLDGDVRPDLVLDSIADLSVAWSELVS